MSNITQIKFGIYCPKTKSLSIDEVYDTRERACEAIAGSDRTVIPVTIDSDFAELL